MLQIQAYQIAESINIKRFKQDFTKEVHYNTSTELFYTLSTNKFLYVFNYGVVVFSEYNEVEKSEFLLFIRPYTENWIDVPFQEDLKIDYNNQVTKFNIQNDIVFFPPSASEGAVSIVMLNVAQSVGLDYYEKLTDDILTGTRGLVKDLEISGKFSISKKKLLKFIGRTLNIKNSIADNLYILDSPNIVWEDPNLEWLNNNLKQLFDTFPRFKDLDYRLKIVEDNLRLFSDLLQHRENKILEYVIIVLILIEVLNLIIEKLL